MKKGTAGKSGRPTSLKNSRRRVSQPSKSLRATLMKQSTPAVCDRVAKRDRAANSASAMVSAVSVPGPKTEVELACADLWLPLQSGHPAALQDWLLGAKSGSEAAAIRSPHQPGRWNGVECARHEIRNIGSPRNKRCLVDCRVDLVLPSQRILMCFHHRQWKRPPWGMATSRQRWRVEREPAGVGRLEKLCSE